MATGYCTPAQVAYYYNTNEITSFADDDGDTVADTDVIQANIDRASRRIYSIVFPVAGSAADPDAYTAGSGTYPILEDQSAVLTADYMSARQGDGDEPGEDHPVLLWAYDVRFGVANIPGL